ncbi:MAG TPA: PEGA domain-containing protein [Thermomicrobiales bacterium]|nr:PEGA domain-containing protein [Thermomicrobiales bacterium]
MLTRLGLSRHPFDRGVGLVHGGPGGWRGVRAAILGLLVVGLVGGGIATGTRWFRERAAATGPPGMVTITSDPPGATVLVDGRVKGRTPLTLTLPGGRRRVTLRRAGDADLSRVVTVRAGRTTAVGGILWRTQPLARRVRPPLPGARIVGADFLATGQIALSVTLGAGSGPGDLPAAERQVWLLDAAGGARRAGPASAHLLAAISPEGRRVAYAALPPAGGTSAAGGSQTPTLGAEPVPTEVWLAPAAGGDAGARRWALPANTAREHLVDLAWAPDGRHLLVVTQLAAEGGQFRSRILRLDADGHDDPRELVVLPSAIAPGSWVWRADGQLVAFLATAADRAALCLLGTGATGVAPSLFRYLADLDPATPLAPLAFAPDGTGHFVYAAASDAAATAGLFGTATRPPGLFTAGLDAPAPARLGGQPAFWPGWRNDGLVVALARARGDLTAVELLDADGTATALATLSVPFGSPGTGPAARWDAEHGRALLLAPSADGGELWLIDWREQPGQ